MHPTVLSTPRHTDRDRSEWVIGIAWKIVVHDTNMLVKAESLFARQQKKMGKGRENRRGGPRVRRTRRQNYGYDVFISYWRRDKSAAQHLIKKLNEPGLASSSTGWKIKTGASWQQKIFDALDDCNLTAVLYSPTYLQSKVCKEEFNIAWIRQRELEREVLFPRLIEDASWPTYMKMLNYEDCRVPNPCFRLGKPA
jgi:TIR domain